MTIFYPNMAYGTKITSHELNCIIMILLGHFEFI